MITVGRLAKQFGLSRTALLYYDSIGLLTPSGRGDNGYRMYSDADVDRLSAICLYRHAGLALEDIRDLMDGTQDDITGLLQKRLEDLGEEIQWLQSQQQIILALLAARQKTPLTGPMTKERWVGLFGEAGLSEADMRRWHTDFERLAPEKHQEFLEFLCISDEDIERIRSWAKGQ